MKGTWGRRFRPMPPTLWSLRAGSSPRNAGRKPAPSKTHLENHNQEIALGDRKGRRKRQAPAPAPHGFHPSSCPPAGINNTVETSAREAGKNAPSRGEKR